MAGLDKNTPHPTELKLHQHSRLLEVSFDNGQIFNLPFELLRVYSPSAAVRGHMPGQAVSQTGKREVGIVDVQPVGNYAVKLVFSDGHDTGIYSWDILHRLGEQQDVYWQDYLDRLSRAGASRDVDLSLENSARQPGKPQGKPCGSGGCGH